MVDLRGPTPEEMKPGETYKVVEVEAGVYELEKVKVEKAKPDENGAYTRVPSGYQSTIAAIPVELEIESDVYGLLSWISRECDISFPRLCSQLVEEATQKLLDNPTELGKLMSLTLKQQFNLHRWIRKDEW